MTDEQTAWERDAEVDRLKAGIRAASTLYRAPYNTEAIDALCVAVATATHAATVAEYEAKLAALEADAMRWRALFKAGGRVRVVGSACLGEPGYQHIGLELWTQHSFDTEMFPDTSDREMLTNYADAARTPSPEGGI